MNWWRLRKLWHAPEFWVVSARPGSAIAHLLWYRAFYGPRRAEYARPAVKATLELAWGWLTRLFWMVMYAQPFSCKGDHTNRCKCGGIWLTWPLRRWADKTVDICEWLENKARKDEE